MRWGRPPILSAQPAARNLAPLENPARRSKGAATMWTFLTVVAGLVLTGLVLLDAFETVILPRAVTRGYRLTRLFYHAIWLPWRAVGRRLPEGPWRNGFLSFFGPLSLLVLFGVWAAGLIVGFGLLQWAFAPVRHDFAHLETGLYLSGTTFFTLGLGDVKPDTSWARLAAVAEAGIGFGFLATIISYLPVIYAAFSLREVSILRLSMRAGSPPSAGELLCQYAHRAGWRDLDNFLRDLEVWSAELLESHLSYPILGMYRSQHRDQSWLAALTTVLDSCALLMIGVGDKPSAQAPITFAMAHRAMLDINHLLSHGAPPLEGLPDRLPPGELAQLRVALHHGQDALLWGEPGAEEKLRRLREIYEPAAQSLSAFLLMPLPPWMPPSDRGGHPAGPAEQIYEGEGATDVSIV